MHKEIEAKKKLNILFKVMKLASQNLNQAVQTLAFTDANVCF